MKLSGLTLLFLFLGYLVVPPDLGEAPKSTVLNDRNNDLLSASIASDGQWRFPVTDSVPYRVEQCVLYFEDEYFLYHPGVNPFSVLRAAYQNLSGGQVKSGASTITMQLARMVRRKDRTFFQKIIEMLLAVKIELYYAKPEIFRQYVSMAPFGGNVVGIDAASWRYYGRPAHLLSWSEGAALAVLPNQPGMIYPGTGMKRLRQKRDFLLRKLLDHQVIDTLTYELSLDEPLPGEPYPLPQKAPHLLATLAEKNSGQQLHTTLDPFWQQKTMEVLERKHRLLKTNGVDNLAALVVDLNDGSILSYVGNTTDPQADGFQVDVIRRPRSSGSILKPILYAAALDEGLILPATLLPDVPSFFGGYSPKNFNQGYEGAIRADKALAMSLNIPFAHLLKDYHYEKFHQDLERYGITTLTEPPGHYGLSLILGGGEVTLWDLAQVYFSLYRKMANKDNYQISCYQEKEKLPDIALEEINIWHTFQAMTELVRPGNDETWENFSSTHRIAWKTGTSFGFRDAWAVGLNGEVLIAVWVGNADGEGRAGLVGSTTAGPVLTELIRLSGYRPGWLEELKPLSRTQTVCRQSGMLAGEDCPEAMEIGLGRNAERSGLCFYHKKVWVDHTGSYEVNRSCYPASEARAQSLFILPPTQGSYYRMHHSDYTGRLPAFPGCDLRGVNQIAITYPAPDSRIFIPRELQGEAGRVIIEASHQDPEAALFWHLNDEYLGITTGEHKQSLLLAKGTYRVTVLDRQGNTTSQSFEVVSEVTNRAGS